MIRNADAGRRSSVGGASGMWRRAASRPAAAMKTQTGAQLADAARSAAGHDRAWRHVACQQAMMAAAAPMLLQRAVVAGDAEGGLMATGRSSAAARPTCRAAPICSPRSRPKRARARARSAAHAAPLLSGSCTDADHAPVSPTASPRSSSTFRRSTPSTARPGCRCPAIIREAARETDVNVVLIRAEGARLLRRRRHQGDAGASRADRRCSTAAIT